MTARRRRTCCSMLLPTTTTICLVLVVAAALLMSIIICCAEAAVTTPPSLEAMKKAAMMTTTISSSRGGGGDDVETSSSAVVVVVRKDDEQMTADADASDEEDCGTKRAKYVRDILSRRLNYANSGRRSKDFAKWVKDRGGDPTIFSMHGVDADPDFSDLDRNENQIEIAEEQYEKEQHHFRKNRKKRNKNKQDPFPLNRMNLDLVLLPGSPSICYVGKPLHLSTRPQPTPLQVWCRSIKLGFHFAPVISTCGLALVSQTFRQKVWYSWLTNCIGNSGAAFIKWGQWSSTRPDMFPDALCDSLETLHADAPAHSTEFSINTMESSLGLAPNTLGQVFDEFDLVPLASGSIAQVHKATLNGNLVAVKIRHPKVAKLIDMDFKLMSIWAKALNLIPGMKWLHIQDSVDQFSHTMAAQADLHVEAHHLEVLNYNFGGGHWQHVRFPTPFYATAAVIIETYESGKIVTGLIDMYDQLAETLNQEAEDKEQENAARRIGDGKIRSSSSSGDNKDGTDGTLVDNKAEQEEPLTGRDLMPTDIAKFLVTTGLSVYLKMLLVDNLMHADLHPGNIMINLNRKTPFDASKKDALAVVPYKNKLSRKHVRRLLGVCLVDAGMVAQLTDDESSTFIGLLASLGEGNGRDAAEFTLQFSIEGKDKAMSSPEEREEFKQEMCDLFSERCRGYGTNVDVGHVLRGVLGLIRKHHVRIDANFATLVVNALCVESLSREVCPNYNLLDAAKPLLKSYRNLCYNSDGTPKLNARKSKFVKFWLSLMYIKKSMIDDKFFKREARKHKEKTSRERLLLD